MGLLSIFKRKDDSPGEAAAAPDAVAAARIRARRRLIGATLLLGIGVIGFPLLFETQPRPIPVDIPIEIPRKDNAPPLVMPPARPASGAVLAESLPAKPVSAPPLLADKAGEQGRDLPKPGAGQAKAVAGAAPAAPAATAAAASPPAGPASTAAARPVVATRPEDADGARARALLDGRTPASEAAAVRIVVQVGAYTDADKLREARLKVEKLGLKTYTQVVEVDGAKRTRVRVGPFDSRDEADKAAARIKAAGLPVALLVL